MTGRCILAFMALLLVFQPTVLRAEQKVLFREDFESLTQWEPLTFPKIKAHSTYTIVKENGSSLLKAESHASASGIVCRRTFNIYKHPHIRWRWKVTQLSELGNPKEKEGDDYSIRVYIMFQYDPARATFSERLIYNATRLIYDKYPPHSTLSYVWAGQEIPERIFVSPYTEKARIVVLEKGRKEVGRWVEESVNVLEDYRKAFGKDPPETAGIAIMSDTDNTGGSATAYLDYIEILE
jgi:hypothetical protein